MFARTTDVVGARGTWPIRRTGAQGGGVKNALLLELDGKPAGYALYRVHIEVRAGRGCRQASR